jgi:hypothetical protein
MLILILIGDDENGSIDSIGHNNACSGLFVLFDLYWKSCAEEYRVHSEGGVEGIG